MADENYSEHPLERTFLERKFIARIWTSKRTEQVNTGYQQILGEEKQ